jgi:general secretion pathway protein N
MPAAASAHKLRRSAAILTVALCAGLFVVLTQAPASFLAGVVKDWSRGRIELGDVSGTIWRGQAAVILGSGDPDPARRTRLPGLTAWRIGAWPLGSLNLTLSNAALLDTPLSLHLDRARNATVEADRLHLPADVLVGVGAPWNTIQPGGELVLEWDPLQVNPAAAGTLQIRGQLRGEWIDASSSLSPVVPFGHYRIEADGIFPGAQVRLETVSGPMEMSGSGTIAQGNLLKFQGTAQVRAGTDATVATQLSGLISLLGPHAGDGASLNFGT